MKTRKLIACTGFVFVALLFCSTAAATASTQTNMVVDFDRTAVTSNLYAGDSGILNLVVSNTGGYRADDVSVYIPSSTVIEAEKRLYVGTIGAGESKTLPIPLKVDSSAKTGLKSLQVTIDYDGFDSEGASSNNKQTK